MKMLLHKKNVISCSFKLISNTCPQKYYLFSNWFSAPRFVYNFFFDYNIDIGLIIIIKNYMNNWLLFIYYNEEVTDKK